MSQSPDTQDDWVVGCLRCQNPMVEEVFVDLEADSGPTSFRGWRCIVCGDVLDSIILQHRTERPEPQFSHARARKVRVLSPGF